MVGSPSQPQLSHLSNLLLWLLMGLPAAEIELFFRIL